MRARKRRFGGVRRGGYDGRMDASLYDEDIYAWAEQQAAALRRAASVPNGGPPDLDLKNLAEEIQDVGKTELRTTTSFIRQAFIHLAKLAADPHSRAALGWGGEVLRFLDDAAAAFAPGMRQAIDLGEVWRGAMRRAHATLRQYGVEAPPDFPAECPFGLDELLREEFDVEGAVARIRSLSGCP